MPETYFGLTAFVRLASLPPNQIVSEIKARKFRVSNGGPPLGEALRRAMKSVFYEGVVPDQATGTLLRQIPARQRPHINHVFRRFCRLVRQPPISPATEPASGEIEGPMGIIGIRLKPEIAYHRGGNTYVVGHWATKNTPLVVDARRFSYSLLKSITAVGIHSGSLVAVQDLVRPQFGSEAETSAFSTDQAQDVIERIEEIWLNVEENTQPRRFVENWNIAPPL